MAKIVLGLGTSHGPQLLTPPQHWSLREAADRKNTALHFGGQVYSFDQLAQHRQGLGIAQNASAQARAAHFERCQTAMARIAEIYAQAQPDVAVILGNDQFEVFTEVNIPAFGVFWGEYVESIPKTAQQRTMIPAGAAFAEEGYFPPQLTRYPGAPQLGRHLIEHYIGAGFDIAQSTRLPVGRMGNNSVPHAYAYIYRQVMRDQVIPHVPVMINTHYPPNRPTAQRCLDFGRALAAAIESWPPQLRVAVIASGGLTHYVIDEDIGPRFSRRCDGRRS